MINELIKRLFGDYVCKGRIRKTNCCFYGWSLTPGNTIKRDFARSQGYIRGLLQDDALMSLFNWVSPNELDEVVVTGHTPIKANASDVSSPGYSGYDPLQNVKGKVDLSKLPNPYERSIEKGVQKGIANNALRAGLFAAGDIAGQYLYKGISHGHNNVVGTGINAVGNTVGSAIGMVNPVAGAIVKGASTVLGGLTNRAFGAKWNDDNIQRIEGTTALNRSVGNNLASASTTGQLAEGFGMANTGLNFTKGDIGRDGWFTNKVGRKYNRLTNQYNASNDYLSHGLAMGAKRVNDMQDNIAIANTAAYGGLFDMLGNTGMGAVDYGFMNDYIASRQKKASDNNAFSNYIPIPSTFGIGGTLFPLGGDLQTHGSDWSTGTKVVDAGGLHETNPNEGVQMGVDSQGTPNLVEEGEVVHNDYVYSDRIKVDDKTKEAFHIGKKRDMTYADLAKKLGREIEERPNDPISQKAYDSHMQELADNQERQKQEMEAQKAKEAFEAMTPDEQMALISQMAAQQQQAPQSPEEEAMMQEQAAQEQMMAEQQMQGMPQEGPLMQQAQMGIEGGVPQEQMMQQSQMAAYGGNVNRYDDGGVLDFLRRLGYATVADAEKAGWKPGDFGAYSDWSDITEATALPVSFNDWNKFKRGFNDRITAPEQRAALKLGWTPTAQMLQTRWYEGDNGNAVNWTESAGKSALTLQELNDYAKRYKNTIGWALDNGLLQLPQGNNTISMADVVAAMKQAPDYKATDEWLGSDIANMEEYLGRSKTLSRDAKGKYDTNFHNTWSKYGKFTENNDGTWSYKLNDKVDKEAFKKLFWDKRNDNMVGLMYNSRTLPREVSTNYLINDDGSVTPILSNDLSSYEAIGSPLSWGDEANLTNRTAAFYKAKAAPATPAASTPPATTPEDNDMADYEPVKHKDWMRYAGIAGPIVAAGLQGLGFGRPDYSRLDAAVDAYNNATRGVADYKPIGNYMRYTPMDIWSEQNRLNANARATDRAIANSGLTAGNRMAGLIAANYGNQVASSDLMKKAMEYNLGENKAVQDFNRGTDQFNASAYNQTSLSNAQMLNQDRQYRGSLAMQAAKERLDTDASWYNSLYGNISGIFRGLADIGRENKEANWRNWLASKGYFDIPGEELERMGMVKRRTT